MNTLFVIGNYVIVTTGILLFAFVCIVLFSVIVDEICRRWRNCGMFVDFVWYNKEIKQWIKERKPRLIDKERP